MPNPIVVKAIWDPEASVWVAHSDDVPGLITEAATVDALLGKLPRMIQDFLDDEDGVDIDVPIQLVAETAGRVRIHGVPKQAGLSKEF
jgi:hypothetical protein